MKKPSGTRVNIMIMGIVVVVLALGLAAILGYGKARKQMEQMQQAQQEQEAKEAQITPTQTVTPEPTDDPTDPAVQKKNLITEIKKAVEHNDVKIMTADLRYTSQEGQVEAYTQEDVAAVLLHLKKNEKDYQAFVEKLQDESVTVPSSDRFKSQENDRDRRTGRNRRGGDCHTDTDSGRQWQENCH